MLLQVLEGRPEYNRHFTNLPHGLPFIFTP